MEVRVSTGMQGRIFLQNLNIRIKETETIIGRWIKWQPPTSPQVKLNVDGSRKGDYCSGGGLIRDSNGKAIRGFSNFYGKGSLIFAEAQAIIDGLTLCWEMGFEQITLESDSKLVVDMIYNKVSIAWEIQYLITRIHHLLKDTWMGRHIYREANAVADELAKMAYEHKERRSYSVADFPRQIRSSLILDRAGVPRFRKGSRIPCCQ
ncbi:PREDICTED: uncharacterized protein LOC105953521 [Erythranthe guttata]|uniref:uncharacterized protein LOC105953521 n=1 Tax=Erythranthe guttata TaxID=4155 RepID=UPI00064DC99B|nr:PREDICTED: uncharacterized protein LOC105953521 [Erythranthe guttata]|eukprot:XP_012832645.1 PREDICTED: uncharacterized protein LOC105953521 [Erythranthe guttata]